MFKNIIFSAPLISSIGMEHNGWMQLHQIREEPDDLWGLADL